MGKKQKKRKKEVKHALKVLSREYSVQLEGVTAKDILVSSTVRGIGLLLDWSVKEAGKRKDVKDGNQNKTQPDPDGNQTGGNPVSERD